jgi:hypothetical protein
VALALVAGAHGASADSAPESIDGLAWSAPAACPDAPAFRQDVARLGGNATADARARVTVSVSPDGGYVATIVIEDRDTRWARTVSATSCASLGEAASLVVAMALRERAESATKERPPDPPLPASRSEAKEVPRAPSTSEVAFGLGLQGLAGVMPAPSPGLGVWAAWLPGRARLSIGGYATTVQSALAANAAFGADLQVLGASAKGCWMLLYSRAVGIGPCAGFDAIRISSVGIGITAPRDAATWDGAGSVGALAAIHVDGPFALALALDALAPTSRPRFVVEGEPLVVLHRPAPVWGRMLLGAEMRF